MVGEVNRYLILLKGNKLIDGVFFQSFKIWKKERFVGFRGDFVLGIRGMRGYFLEEYI